MARNIVTDLGSRVRIETKDLVDKLLEIRIILARRAREPLATKRGVQLIEWYWTREGFEQIERCPDGVHEDLRAGDALYPRRRDRTIEKTARVCDGTHAV
jgi:hypothetical protein